MDTDAVGKFIDDEDAVAADNEFFDDDVEAAVAVAGALAFVDAGSSVRRAAGTVAARESDGRCR